MSIAQLGRLIQCIRRPDLATRDARDQYALAERLIAAYTEPKSPTSLPDDH
jgi:hypothetical protein